MIPVVNAVWIGNKLGNTHAACLKSFVNAGHRTVLHAFDEIMDLPDGVELFDASSLMSRDEIVRHKSGSLALASDIYRYRILKAGMGIYVDCDVFCLKPLPNDEYLLGWESNDLLGSAILNMPANSELLNCIMEATENPQFIPPWYSRSQRRKIWRKRLLGRKVDVRNFEWGTIGPRLVTHHAKRLGLDKLAKEIDYLYPLHYSHRELLNSPELDLSDVTTRRTIAVHLCSSGPEIGGIEKDSVFDVITKL